jgi:AhpD family alkylhydroperoxidase
LENRIDYYEIAGEEMALIMDLEKQLKKTSINRKLRELIKIRVSQINGCAFCIGMHTADARKMKVSEEEIYLLNAWHETNIYSGKEKLAFELAEAVTNITVNGVSEELFNEVRKLYTEEEYTDLILIINQINMWNRLSISMGNKHIV